MLFLLIVCMIIFWISALGIHLPLKSGIKHTLKTFQEKRIKNKVKKMMC